MNRLVGPRQPVGATFAPLKPEEAGSISGTVIDAQRKALPGAKITLYRVPNFSSPPVIGSANAADIADRPDPPTPRPLRSNVLYGVGTAAIPVGTFDSISVGTSDVDGVFAIKNLPSGTYIVNVRAPRLQGSLQPVEVKAGSETKLDRPVQAGSTNLAAD